MMTEVSSFQSHMTTLDEITTSKISIWNPDTQETEKDEFVTAMEKTIQYATRLSTLINNCFYTYVGLAKKQYNGKLTDVEYASGVKEVLRFQEKVEEFSKISRIFKDRRDKFLGHLNAAKLLDNLSDEEVIIISQKQKAYDQINELTSKVLAIIDDDNKKCFLKNNFNWLGQVVYNRQGHQTGWWKYIVWNMFTGADAFQLPVPADLSTPLTDSLIRWADIKVGVNSSQIENR